MSAVTTDPSTSQPKGWSPWRTATGPRTGENAWVDCATCWGQGRYYEQTPCGVDCYVCPTCLGVGQIAAKP